MYACMHIITIIPSSRLQVNFPFEVEISTVDKPEEREMKIQVISFFNLFKPANSLLSCSSLISSIPLILLPFDQYEANSRAKRQTTAHSHTLTLNTHACMHTDSGGIVKLQLKYYTK